MGVISQKKADEIFRDINIGVNGFYLMNYLAYWSLRLGGFLAWNKHRKVNARLESKKGGSSMNWIVSRVKEMSRRSGKGPLIGLGAMIILGGPFVNMLAWAEA